MSDRKMNPPIPGHHLLHEGHSRREIGPDEMYTGRLIGGCACGAQPPGWPVVSIYETKRWHRQHKADLRAHAHETPVVVHRGGKWPGRGDGA